MPRTRCRRRSGRRCRTCGIAATMAFGSSTSALAFALQRTRATIKDVQTMMMQGGRTYTLVRIVADNGAYGIGEGVKARAKQSWSLSKLVFPHQLVRLILAEQVYRACTILRNESYHHE